MRFVALILFALLMIVNLYSCSRGMEKLRRWTKPFLLPLLCLVYVLFAPEAEGFMVAGLLLAALGDLLLLWQWRKPFAIGGMVSFGLGHICYMLAMANHFGMAEAGFGRILWMAALYGAALGTVFTLAHKQLSFSMLLPGMLYMVLLCAMSVCALLCLLRAPMLSTALLYAGSLAFLASDTILLFEMCRKYYGGSFGVMWSYLCAQTLIVAAFIL